MVHLIVKLWTGILFFLLIVVFVVYEFGGGRFYLAMMDTIGQYTGEEKKKIENDVWGSAKDNTYGGVLITANEKGVWIWGRLGPRFFTKKDGSSIYYFYNTCSQENLKRTSQQKSVTTIKDKYSDINVWRKLLYQGDFVSVKWEPNNSGQLQELYGYGSWYFSHKSLVEQCKK